MKYLLYIIAFCLLFAGCKEITEADRKMNMAERLMLSAPDSSLSILDSIHAKDLTNKERKARFALLKSMALDKNYIDTTTFDLLQPAIDYYLSKGSADEKLRTYYYQGRIYQNRKNNDSAMQCFMRGKEYFRQATDTMTMANLLVAQGTIFYPTYKFEDFIKVNLEAAKLYNKMGCADGEVFTLTNALDASIVSENKSCADSIMSITQKKVNQHPECASQLSPYKLVYVITFGDKEELSNFLKYYNSEDSIDDVTKMNIALGYTKIGDSVNASRYLNSINFNSSTNEQLKYYSVKVSVAEQAGDYKGALDAYKKVTAYFDSVHQNIFAHDLLFAQQRHDMEKSNLLKLQKRDRYIWLSLCIAFALLIIAGFIYYRYRLSKTKNLLEEQENKRLQLEQDNLKRKNENLELRNHQVELEYERQALVAENLRMKIEQLEDESASLKEILEKRKDLARPIEDAIKIRIEMLNGLLATQITENDSYAKPYSDWSDRLLKDKDEFMNTTRLAFKATHPRFIAYLEEHGLSEAEINYVCLYAIGLRGKEAGEYIQLKRHYHLSSEIRRKLGIDEHQTNIGIYIRKLMKNL